ncbi:MAG TPA: TIGR03619 family F420-dependent LLM class oxidoreductase [Solirubrobacteraceae bacterium]
MRIGAKLPNSGPLPLRIGIPAMAAALEQAGFDSLWVSDHIVLPEAIDSRYPFAPDGRAAWPTDTPYLDALVALALAAGATERVRLGTAVLVLPLRNPVELAKQAASIDVASGGRLELGVGAGWLAEEFAALGVPFGGRGTRLVEWMGLARACWTGRPPAHASERFTLPQGVLCLPTPAHEIPMLVGGHSPVALRRAGTVGDGWLAQQAALELDPTELARAVAAVADAARAAGRDEGPPRVVLRIVDSLGRADALAARLEELEDAGVDEVIVDVPVEGDAAARDLETLRSAA